MNKKEQRALENRIRDVMEEPAELTSDEIAKIRERAYLAYQQKIENEKQPAREKRKKSGLLRRSVAVVAIAIGLIVVSVVYSVLAPVSVSNANNFIRRAAIWVNDQLHLGISFPVPAIDESNITKVKQGFFSSIDEAAESLNVSIVCIQNQEIDGLRFSGLETIDGIDGLYILIHYEIGNDKVTISMEKLINEESLGIIEENAVILQSPIGDLAVIETEEMNRAITFYNGYLIELYGSLSNELFTSCCHALTVIN